MGGKVRRRKEEVGRDILFGEGGWKGVGLRQNPDELRLIAIQVC
jgi:hypothetical protein